MSSFNKMTSSDAANTFDTESIQDFLDNAVIGIHSVDAAGKIIYVNKAELKFLGYEEQEFLGRNIQDFHADKETIETILFKLRGNTDVNEHHARLICKDGSLKDV